MWGNYIFGVQKYMERVITVLNIFFTCILKGSIWKLEKNNWGYRAKKLDLREKKYKKTNGQIVKPQEPTSLNRHS